MKPKAFPDDYFRRSDAKVYDIGCGSNPYPGSVGVDIVALPEVGIVADLSKKWPFEDDSVDGFIATHVLEHLDILPVVDEIHRCLKPGGCIWIRVPHFTFRNFWSDPTHKRMFTLGTFDFWSTDRSAKLADYGFRAKFEIVHRAIHWYGNLEVNKFRPSRAWFAEPARAGIDLLARLNPRFCERFWSWAVGGFAEVEFVLRKPL
jgi:SAM-dependent methyltransferase